MFGINHWLQAGNNFLRRISWDTNAYAGKFNGAEQREHCCSVLPPNQCTWPLYRDAKVLPTTMRHCKDGLRWTARAVVFMPGLGGAGWFYTPLLLADSDSYKVQKSLQNSSLIWVAAYIPTFESTQYGCSGWPVLTSEAHTLYYTAYFVLHSRFTTWHSVASGEMHTHTHTRKESSFFLISASCFQKDPTAGPFRDCSLSGFAWLR